MLILTCDLLNVQCCIWMGPTCLRARVLDCLHEWGSPSLYERNGVKLLLTTHSKHFMRF